MKVADFLVAVLGASGAKALEQLSKVGAESVVPPRAALGWLRSQERYEGLIPGQDGLSIVFEKSETGYSGVVGPQDAPYAFQDAPVEHVAAAICAHLGISSGPVQLREVDIARLGKTIDLLVKSQNKPANAMAPEMTQQTRQNRPRPPAKREAPQRGVPAAPQAPDVPAPPVPQAPKMAKPKKTDLKAKISKSQAEKRCAICRHPLVSADIFGCICMGAMAKTVTLKKSGDSYDLTFGPGWSREDVLAVVGDQ